MKLIDADALKEHLYSIGAINKYGDVNLSVNTLNIEIDKSKVDAKTVVHGHWIPIMVKTGVSAFGVDEMTCEEEKCSVCGNCFWVGEEKMFCPNCGSKMDGENNGK